MKKLWLLLPTALVLSGLSANAAIVACGAVPISYATWTTTFVGVGNGCSIGDKIFSNFVVSTTPSGSDLAFGQAGNVYTLNLQNTATNGFATSFTFSYDITVDTTLSPTPGYRIVGVTGGMQDATFTGGSSATLNKVLTGGGTGTVVVTDVNGTITPSPVGGLNALSLHVADNFTYVSGNITNIANTFGQADTSTQTPEPLTLSLMGAGLLGLGLLRRRVAR